MFRVYKETLNYTTVVFPFPSKNVVTKFATVHALRTTTGTLYDGDERNGCTNGNAFDRERARAFDGREARLGDVSTGAANSRCAFCFVVANERAYSLIHSFIHSFSLVDLSFFLFEKSVAVLLRLREF